MAIATLDAIITKVRKLTGSSNSFQLTNSQIIDYINSFYLYDFPAQYRALKLQDVYTFNTIRGIDTYPFDYEHYTTVQMPCYCMQREIQLFTNPWSFWGVNFNWQSQTNFATGNGTAGAYTGFATPGQNTNPNLAIVRSVNNNPIVQTPQNPTTAFPSGVPVVFPDTNISRVQNILITANAALGSTLHVTDDGNGTLIGDVDITATNTINYQTGAIQITFSQVIPASAEIQIQYNPQQMSIPLGILFFQNQFTLRPVPDRGYSMRLVSYRLPSQALLGTTDPDNPTLTGVPESNEWWETLAFGASKKIYEDRLDSDGIMLMDKGLAERYALIETRTYAQLGKERIPTIFADQLSYNYGSGGLGFGSGGP